MQGWDRNGADLLFGSARIFFPSPPIIIVIHSVDVSGRGETDRVQDDVGGIQSQDSCLSSPFRNGELNYFLAYSSFSLLCLV